MIEVKNVTQPKAGASTETLTQRCQNIMKMLMTEVNLQQQSPEKTQEIKNLIREWGEVVAEIEKNEGILQQIREILGTT